MKIKNKHLKTLIFAGIIPAICNFGFMVALNATDPGNAGIGVALIPFVFILIGQIVFCIFMFFAYVISLMSERSNESSYEVSENEYLTPQAPVLESEGTNENVDISVSANTERNAAQLRQPAIVNIISDKEIDNKEINTEDTHNLYPTDVTHYYKKLVVASFLILSIPSLVLLLRLNSPVVFLKDTLSYAGLLGYILILAYIFIQLEIFTRNNSNKNLGNAKLITIVVILFSIILGLIILNTISSAFGGRLT